MQLKMFFGNSLSNVMMPPTAWPFAYSDVEIVGETVCANSDMANFLWRVVAALCSWPLCRGAGDCNGNQVDHGRYGGLNQRVRDL